MRPPRPTRLLLPVLAAGLVAAACSSSSHSSSGLLGGNPVSTPASAPGVTAFQVTVAGDEPATGALSPGVDEISGGIGAYFDYVNDNGGIHGRRIVYTALDDAGDPATAASDARTLVENAGVFAVLNSFGTSTHLAERDYLTTAKVPDLFVGSSCTCWNDPSGAPWTFGFQPNATIEGEIEGHYIAQHLAGQRVGYLVENDDLGMQGEKGLDSQIPASSVVTRQSYNPADVELNPQVTALYRARAQVVVLFASPVFTATALLAAARAKYQPTFVVASEGGDIPTIDGLVRFYSKKKVTSSLMENVVTDTYLPPVNDTANPWISLFGQIHNSYDPKTPFDRYAEYGLAVGYTFAQALAAAGPAPTRDGLVQVIENMHFTGPGLTPFAFSSTDHSGYTGVEMGVIHNGAFDPTGPPQIVTASGAIAPYTTAQAPPPATGIPASS